MTAECGCFPHTKIGRMCRKQTFATRNANTRLWYREVTSDDNADVRVGTERVPVVGVWAEHSTCPPRSRQKRAIALTKNGALARGGCSRSRGKIAKACRDGKCGRGWRGGCSGKGELGGGGSSPRAPGPGADAGQKLAEAASEDATPREPRHLPQGECLLQAAGRCFCQVDRAPGNQEEKLWPGRGPAVAR